MIDQHDKDSMIELNNEIFFSLDDEGIIQSLNYNNQMRSQFLNLPIDKIQPLYNALKLFDDICYDNEYLINLKLKPGKFFYVDKNKDRNIMKYLNV